MSAISTALAAGLTGVHGASPILTPSMIPGLNAIGLDPARARIALIAMKRNPSLTLSRQAREARRALTFCCGNDRNKRVRRGCCQLSSAIEKIAKDAERGSASNAHGRSEAPEHARSRGREVRVMSLRDDIISGNENTYDYRSNNEHSGLLFDTSGDISNGNTISYGHFTDSAITDTSNITNRDADNNRSSPASDNSDLNDNVALPQSVTSAQATVSSEVSNNLVADRSPLGDDRHHHSGDRRPRPQPRPPQPRPPQPRPRPDDRRPPRPQPRPPQPNPPRPNPPQPNPPQPNPPQPRPPQPSPPQPQPRPPQPRPDDRRPRPQPHPRPRPPPPPPPQPQPQPYYYPTIPSSVDYVLNSLDVRLALRSLGYSSQDALNAVYAMRSGYAATLALQNAMTNARTCCLTPTNLVKGGCCRFYDALSAYVPHQIYYSNSRNLRPNTQPPFRTVRRANSGAMQPRRGRAMRTFTM